MRHRNFTDPATSMLALVLYTVCLLAGLKALGITTLTWAMVLFPLWGLGIGLVLVVSIVVFIIGALTK